MSFIRSLTGHLVILSMVELRVLYAGVVRWH
jgi:hypothetical protein